jgi:hypothetical protein
MLGTSTAAWAHPFFAQPSFVVYFLADLTNKCSSKMLALRGKDADSGPDG